MNKWSYVLVVLSALLHNIGNARGEPTIQFVDGRWSGGIEVGPANSGFEECWASSTSDDGSTFTLAERENGNWNLRWSNPGWRLQPSHRYDTIALVDFYPQQVRTIAEAKSGTGIEIADIDQSSLLGLIENGHTIILASDGLNVEYDLQGSAKAIQRIRNCFANRS
jgi:hypothetical protein